MPLNNIVDQTVHEVLVIDGLYMRVSRKDKRRRETQGKKSVPQFPKAMKRDLDFIEKKSGFISKAPFKRRLFAPDKA